MIKKIYFLFIVSFLPFALLGQEDEESLQITDEENEALIYFPKVKHDFGKIEEFSGEVKINFEFRNKGVDPLVISDVEASCGCTIPTWTTDSIMPGKSGFIQVAYDPTNRPGAFNKTITVTSNGEQAVTVLTIEGMVMPKPGDLDTQYPVKIGGLQFKRNSLQFGNTTDEKPVTKSIEAYNSTDKIIAFTGSHLGPKHIKVSYQPQAINPGEVGFINITYDASLSRLGYTSDNVVLYTYEQVDSIKPFNIYATVLEYFPPIPEADLALMPSLEVDKAIEDFGNVDINSTLNTEFTIYNRGKQPLNLEEIRTNCDCIDIRNDHSIILPGDSAKLFVKFKITPTTGTQQKLISVFSNDPKKHVKVLTVKAYVNGD